MHGQAKRDSKHEIRLQRIAAHKQRNDIKHYEKNRKYRDHIPCGLEKSKHFFNQGFPKVIDILKIINKKIQCNI